MRTRVFPAAVMLHTHNTAKERLASHASRVAYLHAFVYTPLTLYEHAVDAVDGDTYTRNVHTRERERCIAAGSVIARRGATRAPAQERRRERERGKLDFDVSLARQTRV